jgi:hypothetical protein
LSKSVKEEFYVPDSSELRPERFDLRIEGFSGCIGASVIKIVDNNFIVVLD